MAGSSAQIARSLYPFCVSALALVQFSRKDHKVYREHFRQEHFRQDPVPGYAAFSSRNFKKTLLPACDISFHVAHL